MLTPIAPDLRAFALVVAWNALVLDLPQLVIKALFPMAPPPKSPLRLTTLKALAFLSLQSSP
jgi:hypothetical protein